MKLSISLPDEIAREISLLAKETERSVSWWVQKAWLIARAELKERPDERAAERAAWENLDRLEGALATEFPSADTKTLKKKAFVGLESLD